MGVVKSRTNEDEEESMPTIITCLLIGVFFGGCTPQYKPLQRPVTAEYKLPLARHYVVTQESAVHAIEWSIKHLGWAIDETDSHRPDQIRVIIPSERTVPQRADITISTPYPSPWLSHENWVDVTMSFVTHEWAAETQRDKDHLFHKEVESALRGGLADDKKRGISQLFLADKPRYQPSSEVQMGSLEYLEARFGFRDAQCESSLDKFKGMQLIEDYGDEKYYRRKGENLTAGDARLQSIAYGFYKRQLFFILIKTSGLLNSRNFLTVLQAAYGSGFQPNQFMERYLWFSKKIEVLYEENPINHNAQTTFNCTELDMKKMRDTREKARKAAGRM